MLIGSTIDFKQIFLYQQFLDEVLSEWKELSIHGWINLQSHGQITCTIRDVIDFEQIYRLAQLLNTNMLIGSTIDFKQIFLYRQFLDEVLSEWKELSIHKWIKLQTHGQITCTIRDLIDFEQIYRLAQLLNLLMKF